MERKKHTYTTQHWLTVETKQTDACITHCNNSLWTPNKYEKTLCKHNLTMWHTTYCPWVLIRPLIHSHCWRDFIAQQNVKQDSSCQYSGPSTIPQISLEDWIRDLNLNFLDFSRQWEETIWTCYLLTSHTFYAKYWGFWGAFWGHRDKDRHTNKHTHTYTQPHTHTQTHTDTGRHTNTKTDLLIYELSCTSSSFPGKSAGYIPPRGLHPDHQSRLETKNIWNSKEDYR